MCCRASAWPTRGRVARHRETGPRGRASSVTTPGVSPAARVQGDLPLTDQPLELPIQDITHPLGVLDHALVDQARAAIATRAAGFPHGSTRARQSHVEHDLESHRPHSRGRRHRQSRPARGCPVDINVVDRE